MIRIFALLSFTFLLACGNSAQSDNTSKLDRKALKTEIEVLVKVLESDQSGKIDKAKAQGLIDKSLRYVGAFPKDSLSAGYLFRAADVCVGIGEYQKAIDYWGNVHKNYPDYKRAPMAVFFQGFTSDNHMQDKDQARMFYQKFINEYPNHPNAAQAKLLLEQLNVSPEELVKQFKNREKK